MDILLTEEEQILQRSARDFLESECRPELARAMESDPRGYPPELWKKLAELDWLGLALPAEYGGQGLPLTYLGIFVEELGRVIAPVPFLSTITAALAIAADGSAQQKQQILPGVSRGETILSWAFNEKDPRFIAEAIHTRATATGDGYRISGEKLFVENFHVSSKCLVACRVSDKPDGIALFLVDTDAAGITETPLVTIARDKQSKVTFDNVLVSRDSLVGGLDQGWAVVQRMIERGTALLCCQLLGATRAEAEMAIDYAKNRIAFGRPIGSFQSIGHMCADMIILVDGGQLLTQEALWRMDQGLPASIEVSQAKAFSNDKCIMVGRMSNMIHGGIAFIDEFNLNLWYRRIAGMTMRLGTSFEHRAKVAAALIDRPGHIQLGEDLYELRQTAPQPAAVS